jgi:hypothetical protein
MEVLSNALGQPLMLRAHSHVRGLYACLSPVEIPMVFSTCCTTGHDILK